MDVLVTGANGFVASAVCAQLMRSGYRVFGLSKQAVSKIEGLSGYYQQDIAQSFRLPRSFDAVVHLAAYNITHIGDTQSSCYNQVNVQGTRHVLEGIAARNFIYVSTIKVYKQEGKALTETSVVAPQGAYEKSKWEAEEICRSSFKGDRLILLRVANILGVGQAPKAVLPVFFQKAFRGETLEISVPADTRMQFVALEDAADAVEKSLKSQVQGVFNIASSEVISIDELARSIIKLTQSSSAIQLKNLSLPAPFSEVKTDKALIDLGWKASSSMETILKRYLQHYHH